MVTIPRLAFLVSMLFVISLVSCAQPPAPSAPAVAKPADKPVAAPAERTVPKAEPQVEAKPAAKVEEKAKAKQAPKAEQKAEPKPAPAKALPASVGLGTSPITTSYHSVGAGVAKVASDHTAVKVIVKPFAGPTAWLPLMNGNELELGVLSGMELGWAYAGEASFDKPLKNTRLLLRGGLITSTGLAVRADSAIKSIKDLRGKRVTGEYGGNAVIHRIVTSWLESVGLTWDDVRPVPVADSASGHKALREGRADAIFAGAPTSAAALETDAAVGLRALDFGDVPPNQVQNVAGAMIDKLRKQLPAAAVSADKKAGFLKSDSTVIGYPVLLAGAAALSPEAAYEITKAIYENDKELHPIHAWLSTWKKETMFDVSPPVPHHDGAIRFWKEKGLWNEAADAKQKEILGR